MIHIAMGMRGFQAAEFLDGQAQHGLWVADPFTRCLPQLPVPPPPPGLGSMVKKCVFFGTINVRVPGTCSRPPGSAAVPAVSVEYPQAEAVDRGFWDSSPLR